jgi:hypothetical protein
MIWAGSDHQWKRKKIRQMGIFLIDFIMGARYKKVTASPP